MLKIIKDEYTEKEKNLEAKLLWNDSIKTITTEEQTNLKSMKNYNSVEPSDAKNPKNLTSKSGEFIKPNADKSMFNTNLPNEVIIPDIPEIDIKDENKGSSENDRHSLEDAVSPPPSTTIISVVNSQGVPILVPAVKGMATTKTQPNNIIRYLTSSEKRKQRNREASRRYRERARENPELLKKMREQQNARQKKYYARLRMKKMKEEEWCSNEEETGDISKRNVATYKISNNM